MENDDDSKLCEFHSKSHYLYDETLPEIDGVCCLCDEDATHLAICMEDIEHPYCCEHWAFKEICRECKCKACTVCGTLIKDDMDNIYCSICISKNEIELSEYK